MPECSQSSLHSQDFHVYAPEWEPAVMRWFIDDQPVHTTTNGIPHTPHYLILNTAVGGAWPGDPDAMTLFPQFHDIDYFRFYQRERYFSSQNHAAEEIR